MYDKSKRRPFVSLQLFERGDYRHNPFWGRAGLAPISKKTVPKIFVNYPVLILDDLLATKNPRAKKEVQVFAPHLLAERGKAADVRNQKPAWNFLDLSQCSLH